MSTTAAPTATTDLWFLDNLVSIRVARADGSDGVSILDHRGPMGSSPPLHIHRNEDEIFHILEGDFRFSLAGQIRRARPGDIFLAPKGIPHTYRIDSPSGGRCLTITAHGDFEHFVRAVGRPAHAPGASAAQSAYSPSHPSPHRHRRRSRHRHSWPAFDLTGARRPSPLPRLQRRHLPATILHFAHPPRPAAMGARLRVALEVS